MFVELPLPAIDALIDLAREEVEEITAGRSYYGDRDETIDMLSLLADTIKLLDAARDEARKV